MPFTGRMRPRLGWFYFNLSMPRLLKLQNPLTSWGIKVGRFSRNFTNEQNHADLPGPINWSSRGRR